MQKNKESIKNNQDNLAKIYRDTFGVPAWFVKLRSPGEEEEEKKTGKYSYARYSPRRIRCSERASNEPLVKKKEKWEKRRGNFITNLVRPALSSPNIPRDENLRALPPYSCQTVSTWIN